MSRRKPKHFTSRDQILQAIDDAEHSIRMAVKLSAVLEVEADEIRQWLNDNPIDKNSSEQHRAIWHGKRRRMVYCREEHDIKQRSIPRFNNTINILKMALAEFDTLPMPFLGKDTGVRTKT